MPTPYIGVTGFMRRAEVAHVLEHFTHPTRLFMAGILVSEETIAKSRVPFKTRKVKQPDRHPALADIATIFPSGQSNVLNLVHYSTKEPETLLEQMELITSVAGRSFGGFQLNVEWPRPEVLETYRRRHPGKRIALQVRRNSRSPESLAGLVSRRYQELFDYILVDNSAGTGSPLDPAITGDYLRALREEGVEEYAGLGAAGGLSAKTLPLAGVLADEFPDLCINADLVDLRNASAYASEACRELPPRQAEEEPHAGAKTG